LFDCLDYDITYFIGVNGKAAISLGLTDSSPNVPEPPFDFKKGFIHTKATLVIVPSHLMDQCPSTVNKFLGSTKNTIVVKNMITFNSSTIDDILRADICYRQLHIFVNDDYFAKLAALSGISSDAFLLGTKEAVTLMQSTRNYGREY
jgi:hypothetical protein